MKTATLHELVWAGDHVGVRRVLARRDAVEQVNRYDEHGRTPLMQAVSSPNASVALARDLIDHGADVSMRERLEWKDPQCVLASALRAGNVQKVALLLERGADLQYNDGCVRCDGGEALGDAACAARDVEWRPLFDLVISRLTAAGWIAASYVGDALITLSRDVQSERIRYLLEAGISPKPLKWTPLLRAVALGGLEDVKREIAAGSALEEKDAWGRTAFLLAAQLGDLAKVRVLEDAGADRLALGRWGGALHYAIHARSIEMLEWLLLLGVPVDHAAEGDGTALEDAVDSDNPEAVDVLIAAGADVNHPGDVAPPLWHAHSGRVAAHLLAAGADPSQLQSEACRGVLGLPAEADERLLDASVQQFREGQNQIFGNANPERQDFAFWKGMIRSGLSAWAASRHYESAGALVRRPVWCAARFGQSITFLPDGRIVQIGGEHEDGYDPDFCIYNDVFVHHPDRSIDIYGYPESVFPPTDNHTATLVRDRIYVIGGLCYEDIRRQAETPVYRLDTTTFRIERLEASGENPGWIWDHRADLAGEHEIRITGGKLLGEADSQSDPENTDVWVLDIREMRWRRE